MIALLSPTHAEEVPPPAETATEDGALVRATLDADPTAFEEIVRRHSRRVYNFLHQFTRHHHDAEDLTQQTFLKAYQNLHRFDRSRPLINWLFTIARRSALNHFRAAKKWEEMPEDAASESPSPARRTESSDEAENLWNRAREVLSPREYEVLWLRFAEELSTEETARIAGLTVTHVKVLVHRARQQLMKGAMPS
ncbi:MAG TPA: sigma-70 family RNA polymerase sigma factor [Opitutaceae bacterium]|nr:sigma-70 family RNA polymerase sigma factor [Opitutaceae bacterium]